MTRGEDASLPQAGRRIEDLQGHWLLARMGKRVLRPGGAELTRTMLADARLDGADVVEFAPGLGRTATEILAAGPRSYTGVDQDADAVRRVSALVAGRGQVRQAEASDTGLPDACADVVVGEAMLTMQGERGKHGIITEAVRLLRPGGRYAIHELGLTPDEIQPEVATEIRRSLARAIKVNARPLTIQEWSDLLEGSGLVVEAVSTAPMALLRMRRNLQDEGIAGVARMLWRVLRNSEARARILAMRRTFTRYEKSLIAVAIIARKPAEQSAPADAAPEEAQE